MMVGLLMWAPAALIGWLLVRRLVVAPGRSGWVPKLFEISLGAGTGIGIVAIVFFVLLWAHIGGRAVLLSVEAVIGACAVWLAMRQHAVKSVAERAVRPWWTWMLIAASALALVFFAMGAAASLEANPHGSWDAFSIWNLKAKFLAGGSEVWQVAVTPVAGSQLVGASHPGYPLLLPSAVASVWTIQGEAASATPAALGLLFAFATAAILCGGVARLRGDAAGLLALLLLLSSDGFASQIAYQYADIPVSFYILATVALLALADDGGWPRGTLLLAGLCCGLAAWTKNEGLPFLILALAVTAWKGGIRVGAWMACGAAPAILLLSAFKLLLVHDSEAVLPRSAGEALKHMADPSRWLEIAGSFARSVWHMGFPWAHPLVLAAILAVAFGLAPRARLLRQMWLAIPVLGLLAADFLIYLVTTADLSWHLSTSNTRVLVQVWPALLLLTMLAINPPALPDAAPQELSLARGKAAREGRHKRKRATRAA